MKLILHHAGLAVRVIKRMRDRECFCWEDRCQCSLKNGGYAIAWFGAIYRSVAIFAVTIRIEKKEETEDYVHIMLYSILLTYCFISLGANFLLLVGISKKNHNYLIPYLGIYGVEILSLVAALPAGIYLIVTKQSESMLSYFIPCQLIFIGLYTYLWSLLLRLFHEFKQSFEFEQSSDDIAPVPSQKSNCGYVICRCNCFKSDSLDIVTYQ